MWFVVGSVAVYVPVGPHLWRTLLFSLAALTIVRILPAFAAMLGSTFSWRDRLRLGPRGTTSIVFALLACNGLSGEPADFALITMVFTVFGSVVLHGAGVLLAAGLRATHRHPDHLHRFS